MRNLSNIDLNDVDPFLKVRITNTLCHAKFSSASQRKKKRDPETSSEWQKKRNTETSSAQRFRMTKGRSSGWQRQINYSLKTSLLSPDLILKFPNLKKKTILVIYMLIYYI